MSGICEEDKCTGCGLCSNICPVNAIRMVSKSCTGHFKPYIDSEKCIECGLCKEKCPSSGEATFYRPYITYAAWHKNAKKQLGSSSGGVAAALYETAIDNGYLIVGASMKEDFSVQLCLSNSRNDIAGFKSSKYEQAYSGEIYKECKEKIMSGKKVLFVGTPCQCEAVKRCIPAQYENNLVTVDLICHGVPSHSLLKDYIQWIENQKNETVESVSFRTPYGEQMVMKDGKGKDIWKRKWQEDFYLTAFNCGILSNSACCNCKYAQPLRCSDITIGDFWGIGKVTPFKHPGRKVSFVGVNTLKGEEFFALCKFLELEEREYEEAIQGNAQLQAPTGKNSLYDTFWREYEKNGIEVAMKSTIYREVMHKHRQIKTKESLKKHIKYVMKFVGIFPKR